MKRAFVVILLVLSCGGSFLDFCHWPFYSRITPSESFVFTLNPIFLWTNKFEMCLSENEGSNSLKLVLNWHEFQGSHGTHYFTGHYLNTGTCMCCLLLKGQGQRYRLLKVPAVWTFSVDPDQTAPTMLFCLHLLDALLYFMITLFKLCSRERVWLRFKGLLVPAAAQPHTCVEIYHKNNFYSHSPPSADSRRAGVSFWQKYVH